MGKQDDQKEDVFQAVLLADNFTNSIFGPVWAENRHPVDDDFGDNDKESDGQGQDYIEHRLAQETLVPLANRKLIDYSLEALTVSGVQEVFVFCSTGSEGGDVLKEHIKNTKWNDLPVKIHVISSEDCQSLGDALRDLDAKGMIRGDFILMAAGVITNKGLRGWLDMHKKTMKADKGAVMTLVQRKIPPGHRSRSKAQEAAIVVNSSTGKVIAYSQKVKGKALSIPLESVTSEMEVLLDTVDTGIYLCSNSVLPLFTDNFDFSNLPDFIKNILMNEEVMGNTIYVHQVHRGYANRVVDFDTYRGVSLDVIQRWTFPLVPDMPFGSNPDDSVYGFGFDFIYKVSNVKAARNAKVGPVVLIGSSTTIGTGSVIRYSCVGNSCKIGNDVTVVDSQIGNSVIIGDGCKVEKCIILDGTSLPSGTILPLKTIVAGSKKFPIEAYIEEEFSDSEDEINEPGYVTDGSGAGDEPGHQEKDFKRFCAEVLESLHRGFTDNVQLDNLFVEIQGSRTANYMYFDDATIAVIKGILGLAPKLNPKFSTIPVKDQLAETKRVILKFNELLKLYVKNQKAQESLLQTVEEYANDNPYFRPMVSHILHHYYDSDVLEEDIILSWHKRVSLYEAGAEVRRLTQKFIEWLEEESEEDSDEDDDDD